MVQYNLSGKQLSLPDILLRKLRSHSLGLETIGEKKRDGVRELIDRYMLFSSLAPRIPPHSLKPPAKEDKQVFPLLSDPQLSMLNGN